MHLEKQSVGCKCGNPIVLGVQSGRKPIRQKRTSMHASFSIVVARDPLYRHLKRFGIEDDNPAAD